MPTNQQVAVNPPIERVLKDLIDSLNQSYPDSGVAYGSYYKVRLSGSRFQLRKQTPVRILLQSNTATAQITSKATYITAINVHVVNFTQSSAGNFTLYDSSAATTNERLALRVDTSENYHWTCSYPTPIQFKNGVYLINGLLSTGGSFRVELYGWQED